MSLVLGTQGPGTFEMSSSNLMKGSMSTEAVAAAKEYEVLIHAISHEHTRENYDRHVLVLEKWLRDYANGFFMRDLPQINFIIVVLRERITTHTDLFLPIVTSMLKVCSKPLYEGKANERLRTYVQDNIMAYYVELAKLWDVCDMRTRINLATTFRCIVNGGVDPRTLKVDVIPFETQDDRTPMTDKSFIQELLRDAGVTSTIIGEFLSSVDLMASFTPDAYEAMAAPLNAQKRKDEDDEGDGSRGPATSQGMNADDSDDEPPLEQSQAMSSVADGGSPGAPQQASLEDMSSALLTKSDDGMAVASECGKVFLDLLVELSVESVTCVLMADNSVCIGLIRMLTVAAAESLRDERVATCVDMVWKCLGERVSSVLNPALKETGGFARARENFANSLGLVDFEYTIRSLKALFLRLLFEGYRLADKELRNEVVILFTLLANFPQSVPHFVSSGLITTLVTYACVGEAGKESWPFFDENVAKPRNFATPFDVDHQLKSSLWMLLSDVLHSSDPDVLLCVGASPFLSVILSYMEVDSSDNRSTAGSVRDTSQMDEGSLLSSIQDGGKSTLLPHPREVRDLSHIPEFPPIPGNEPVERPPVDTSAVVQYFNALPIAQLRDLQVLGMNVISKNAPVLLGEFERIDGPLRVLEVIHRYCDSDVAAHKELVYNALLTLTRCLMSCTNRIKPILQKQDLVAICLHIFAKSDEEYSRAQSLRLVSIMCDEGGVENQRQFRVNDGPRLVVREIATMVYSRNIQVGRKARIKVAGMSDELELAAEGGETSVLTVAMLDVIHKAVIGNGTNEASFANVEGIDALLDLLETSDFLQRVKVLRVLADLLENARLVPYAHAWRSARTMRPAAQLITHSWMDEESRLVVARDEGTICNIFDPLGDHAWPIPALGHTSLPETASTASALPQDGLLGAPSLGEKKSIADMSDSLAPAGKGGNVPTRVRTSALEKDTRGILASILQLLGMLDASEMSIVQNLGSVNDPEADENSLRGGGSSVASSSADLSVKLMTTSELNLDPQDKQVIALARRYDIIRFGEWWREVRDDLASTDIRPIEADHFILEHNLRDAFDAAMEVQLEQMELRSEAKRAAGRKNDEFVNSILDQKHQQIKAEFLKRRAKRNAGLSMPGGGPKVATVNK